MLAVLCDEKGETMLGSDGYVHVDGRKTVDNKINEVEEYRQRFVKHFPHKAKFWTHVMFVRRVADLPDSYNRKSMPRRHKMSTINLAS